MDEGYLDIMRHQQSLLYLVCGLGGVLLVMIAVFIVCKCKAGRHMRDAAERRKANGRNRSKQTQSRSIRVGSNVEHDGDKTRENRSRKRSLDMRNISGTGRHGSTNRVSIVCMDDNT